MPQHMPVVQVGVGDAPSAGLLPWLYALLQSLTNGEVNDQYDPKDSQNLAHHYKHGRIARQ